MCAVCGDQCTITIAGGSTFEGHKFSINVKSLETDTRKFGDGRFGSWTSCSAEGTVTVNTYLQVPNLVTGGTANIVCAIPTGGVSFSATAARLGEVTCDVDSKGIVEWTYSFKLQGAVSGW